MLYTATLDPLLPWTQVTFTVWNILQLPSHLRQWSASSLKPDFWHYWCFFLRLLRFLIPSVKFTLYALPGWTSLSAILCIYILWFVQIFMHAYVSFLIYLPNLRRQYKRRKKQKRSLEEQKTTKLWIISNALAQQCFWRGVNIRLHEHWSLSSSERRYMFADRTSGIYCSHIST